MSVKIYKLVFGFMIISFSTAVKLFSSTLSAALIMLTVAEHCPWYVSRHYVEIELEDYRYAHDAVLYGELFHYIDNPETAKFLRDYCANEAHQISTARSLPTDNGIRFDPISIKSNSACIANLAKIMEQIQSGRDIKCIVSIKECPLYMETPIYYGSNITKPAVYQGLRQYLPPVQQAVLDVQCAANQKPTYAPFPTDFQNFTSVEIGTKACEHFFTYINGLIAPPCLFYAIPKTTTKNFTSAEIGTKECEHFFTYISSLADPACLFHAIAKTITITKTTTTIEETKKFSASSAQNNHRSLLIALLRAIKILIL